MPKECNRIQILLGTLKSFKKVGNGRAMGGGRQKIAAVRNRKIRWIISLLLVKLYFFALPTQAQYGGGTGEPNDPYLINTAGQMNEIGLHEEDRDKNFKLMADIDLSTFKNTDFNIIGIDWDKPFQGVFEGNGKIIFNFSYTSKDNNFIGLFRCVGQGAEIKDLGIIDPNIDAGSGYGVGSLVGENSGNITNCYVVVGNVSGYYDVGGLVGSNSGTIIDCYFAGYVSGSNGVGGLVGANYEGTISNCLTRGDVSGKLAVGGLVGDNPAFDGVVSTIINCYSSSDVSGGDYVGGLVGSSGWSYPGDHFTVIRNCYSIGNVFGNENVGGLVGDNLYESGSIITSFWNTESSGQSTSAGGTGKTTAEMQMESTFTDAGWDFVGEVENGTEDIWWILEGQSYPRLWWQYDLSFSPYPQDGAIDVIQPVILNWLPGGSGLYHDVYLGEDEEAVASATIESPGIYRGRQPVEVTTLDPNKLALDTTYYWRIDEVNEDDPNSPWKGNVWNFTTANFIIVDDFETYNDLDPEDPDCKRIFLVWIDGWDNPAINGSVVGCVGTSPVCWPTVHSGIQSMPFSYDNSVGISQATANVENLTIGRDWTVEDVRILSLWFHGLLRNTAEPMYLALADDNGTTGVSCHDNPNAARIEQWTEWTIDLQEFADHGVDLTNVDTISIGFGDRNNPQPGGTGQMKFDDIRLYRSAHGAAL